MLMPIVGHACFTISPRLFCTFRIAEGHEAVAHGKPPLAPGTSDWAKDGEVEFWLYRSYGSFWKMFLIVPRKTHMTMDKICFFLIGETDTASNRWNFPLPCWFSEVHFLKICCFAKVVNLSGQLLYLHPPVVRSGQLEGNSWVNLLMEVIWH